MDFFLSVLKIVIIDIVLSGDNAVVIGMAAHRLDPQQRKTAILFGGVAALVLRIALTAIAARLLGLTGLQLLGGILLIWIAFKLLKAEEESHEGLKAASSMRDAILTILIADVVMSLDNVLGVAAASHGSMSLLLFGLVLSMAILMFMGTLVANMVNKLWWLAYVGSGVIAWTGAEMIFKDAIIAGHAEWLHSIAGYILSAAITAGTLLFAHWFHRVRK